MSLADHLWQSTLCAAGVALLALFFRRNRAHVRYRLWLAASVKFLFPFAVLVALGSQIEGPRVATATAAVTAILDPVTQPFSQFNAGTTRISGGSEDPPLRSAAIAALIVVWLAGCAAILATWVVRWLRMSAAARAAVPLESGSVRAALDRLGSRGRSVAIRESRTTLEPAVFGIRRPVLLWPHGIDAHLDDAQVEAILAHELAHVRRRDNLTAAVHMIVEALFWFHPLVWWIGARLVGERERACDEEVVRRGIEPHVYAQSILKTCQFYVESPLACIAGVTGSDLKKRMETIMRDESLVTLSATRRVLLGAALFLAVAAPVAIGALGAPRFAEQGVIPEADDPVRFAAASVRPSAPDERGRSLNPNLAAGRFRARNLTLKDLILNAYGSWSPLPLPLAEDRMSGGPDWMDSDRFTIEATADRPLAPPEMASMLRNLLRDRFKLIAHVDRSEKPVYAMRLARRDGALGPQLRPAKDCETGRQGIGGGAGRHQLSCASLDLLAFGLGEFIGRPVFNRTGLTGPFDGTLEHAPTAEEQHLFGEPAAGDRPANLGPSLFTALEEQFGLKLDPERTMVDVLVIDSIEKPTEH